jgi:hypothetical protein
VEPKLNQPSQLFLHPEFVPRDRPGSPVSTGRNFADLVKTAKVDGRPGYCASIRPFGAKGECNALQILDGLDSGKVPRYADETDALNISGEGAEVGL